MLPPRPPSYCRNDRVRLLIPNLCFFFFFAFKFEKTDSSSTSYIIAVSTLKTGPRYFSLFLMLGGLFGSYNVALAVSTNHPIPWSIKKTKKLICQLRAQWISSTFPRPRAKRAAAYAIINSLGYVPILSR